MNEFLTLIRMVEQFRMSNTSNHPLTMHHYRRNSSPESRPYALKAILAPAIQVNLPLPKQRASDPHRDQILILEEVNSCNHQSDVATNLPQ